MDTPDGRIGPRRGLEHSGTQARAGARHHWACDLWADPSFGPTKRLVVSRLSVGHWIGLLGSVGARCASGARSRGMPPCDDSNARLAGAGFLFPGGELCGAARRFGHAIRAGALVAARGAW